MSAHRHIAASLRRLGHERQLVDFVLRSQSIANDATVADTVPGSLGGADQRRAPSPLRGDFPNRNAEELEPIGQSLFGDGAGGGGGAWWTAPAGD
jgi:hypothetical protein